MVVSYVQIDEGRERIEAPKLLDFPQSTYLITEKRLEMNSRNNEGLTALDLLKQTKESVDNQHLEAMLMKARGKTRIKLLFTSPKVDNKANTQPILSGHHPNPASLRLSCHQRNLASHHLSIKLGNAHHSSTTGWISILAR